MSINRFRHTRTLPVPIQYTHLGFNKGPVYMNPGWLGGRDRTGCGTPFLLDTGPSRMGYMDHFMFWKVRRSCCSLDELTFTFS